MTDSPNKSNDQERQEVSHGAPNGVSAKDISEAFSTVPWMEFHISAKPNHRALATNPVMQHLVGQTAGAALNSIANKVTERIVSSMHGIVEKTVREVIANDIPQHVAAILQATFKDHPVPAEPVAVTGFQRLIPRSVGGNSVMERVVTSAPATPATDPVPASAPAPVDEVSGNPSVPGSYAESGLDVKTSPAPLTTISDHIPQLRERFGKTDNAGTGEPNATVRNSAVKTNSIEVQYTTDAPVLASVVQASEQGVEAQPEPAQSDLEKVPRVTGTPSPTSAPPNDLDGEEKVTQAVVGTEAQNEDDSGSRANQEGVDMSAASGENNEEQTVEAQPEPVQGGLEKVHDGTASPSPASAPPGDVDGEEKGTETAVETEAQVESDSGAKANQEEVDTLAVPEDNKENIHQAKDGLDSIDKIGDPEVVESASATAQDAFENQVEEHGAQPTADEGEEQHSSTEVDSPPMTPEAESPVAPKISAASWIWSADDPSSQENISSAAVRVFRKIAHVPMMVDTMFIDIVFPKAGRYTIHANKTVFSYRREAHEDRLKIRRFQVTLEEPADTVIITVSAPVDEGAAETPGSGTGGDSKPGLILAGVLWMNNSFHGRICRIKTNGRWKSTVVASGEAGLTQEIEWKRVKEIGPYGTKPWGEFRAKGQVGPDPEQLPEPDKEALVPEVVQKGTKVGGESTDQ
ncbi:hypothetical protein D9619_007475 [Psilocybe cf. subviscida]|uniref:Uncharacterized protein n=1 Tax=Psilocybe cf. subviscida TaxID=2480587 RepID=A0A8H5B1I9_9AGAR|nr:hypothetical protein D9619_007475 [Psilocybe cf. subviscida]